MANHKPIRSKWQDFLTAYKKGHVLVDLGNGILRVPDRLRGWNKAKLDDYLKIGDDEMQSLPRYVFSDESKPIIRSQQTIETIELLKEFGRYRLPHPICVAEYNSDEEGVRLFAICYEKKDCDMFIGLEDSRYPFVVVLFALHDYSVPAMQAKLKRRDDTQMTRLVADHFAVLYPLISDMQNESPDFIFDDAGVDNPELRKVGGVSYATSPAPWLAVDIRESGTGKMIDRDVIVQEYVTAAGLSIRALTTLLQTKGIARDTITTHDLEKLNRKRTGAKSARIPPHTYITLGHACKRDGVAIPNPTGRKLRFHMRAGHVKMQPCGPNNSERKRIFVEPYLVNENANEALVIPNRIVKA